MELVVGVDGGGSKTHAAVADLTGSLLAEAIEGSCAHTRLGFDGAAAVIDRAVCSALQAASAGGDSVVAAGCFISGLDLPEEEAALRAALGEVTWARHGLLLDNDVFAVLRAGTTASDAAAVVCGTGMNAVAVRGDGAVARFLAMGRDTGDWGGGLGLAHSMLWHAARAEDGRGPATTIRDALLAWTGAGSMHDLSLAVIRGELHPEDWTHRVPELLAMGAQGDPVAQTLVTRQGTEIAVMAAAALERLDLAGSGAPVVVGGGIGASGDAHLEAAVREALGARSPGSEVIVLDQPPVVGAVRAAAAFADRLAES